MKWGDTGIDLRRSKSLLFRSCFLNVFLLGTFSLLSLSFIKKIYFCHTPFGSIWEKGLVGLCGWSLPFDQLPVSRALLAALSHHIPYIRISLPGLYSTQLEGLYVLAPPRKKQLNSCHFGV